MLGKFVRAIPVSIVVASAQQKGDQRAPKSSRPYRMRNSSLAIWPIQSFLSGCLTLHEKP